MSACSARAASCARSWERRCAVAALHEALSQRSRLQSAVTALAQRCNTVVPEEESDVTTLSHRHAALSQRTCQPCRDVELAAIESNSHTQTTRARTRHESNRFECCDLPIGQRRPQSRSARFRGGAGFRSIGDHVVTAQNHGQLQIQRRSAAQRVCTIAPCGSCHKLRRQLLATDEVRLRHPSFKWRIAIAR